MTELPLNPTQSVIKRNPHLYPGADVPRGTSDALKILDRIDKEYAVRDQLNKTERRYYQWLSRQEDLWIGVQCVKFRLADKCWYCPDFIAVDTLGLKAIDVKAFWKSMGSVRIEDDAAVKIKCCARLYPMIRFMVAYEKDGAWNHREYHNA